jgi:pSer/pThr/pTyr-binding forkhead associated (FHA) protein
MFFLIVFEKGRGNECEIRLSDISVSRFHTSLKLENNKLILKDNSSKFGTLFLSRKNIYIGQNHLFIQCGRTLLEVYSSKKWYSNFPCISKTKN